MLLDLAPRSRMQPPCTPAAMRTSNPCSSGLSQRSAMPIPASALPVAMASSSCSVEPPKFTKSTFRLCLANTPRSFATGPATVQIELAFQASVSWRGGPASGSSNAATRQTGNLPSGSEIDPPPNADTARTAPNIANGVAAPKPPAKARIARRESSRRVGTGIPLGKPLRLSVVCIAVSPTGLTHRWAGSSLTRLGGGSWSGLRQRYAPADLASNA